jgi:hypothetical protein
MMLLGSFFGLTHYGTLAIALSLFASLLFSWRFWRFTVRPLFHPKEPKELPYWTPFIGHAIAYLRDSYSTITYGRLFFGDDRKPFSMTLGGEVMYILTAPQDVVAA